MGYGHRNIAAKQQYHALLCCTQTGEVSNQSDCMISAAVIGDIRFFKKNSPSQDKLVFVYMTTRPQERRIYNTHPPVTDSSK